MSSKNNKFLNENPDLERALYSWKDKNIFIAHLREWERNAFGTAVGTLGEVSQRAVGATNVLRTLIGLFQDADLKPYDPPKPAPDEKDGGLEGTF